MLNLICGASQLSEAWFGTNNSQKPHAASAASYKKYSKLKA
jgi:hypothetical protein